MALRQKNSLADDVIKIVSTLPWWAGIILAVVLYLLLHRVAGQQVMVSSRMDQLGVSIIQTFWKSLATFGQYLLPVLCLAGAGVSALARRKRCNLVLDVGNSDAADALDRMSWREFEMLVGESFRLEGYSVTETGGAGADGGVDLILSKNNEKFLVQCKHWKAFKVGVQVVRELYGVMAAAGAVGGFVVTSGRFTNEAVRFADGRNLTLVDGSELHRRIQRAMKSKRETVGNRNPAVARPEVVLANAAAAASIPTCPVCQKPMVKRRAKRGANAGVEFWGCDDYPACRGKRQI